MPINYDHAVYEDIYEEGWADGFVFWFKGKLGQDVIPKNNPYMPGTKEYQAYDDGYKVGSRHKNEDKDEAR